MPCPFVSSFFILSRARVSWNICHGDGVFPDAQDSEALLSVRKEDLARLSILLTALVARGAIQSEEQISAGSGVEAQAVKMSKAGQKSV